MIENLNKTEYLSLIKEKFGIHFDYKTPVVTDSDPEFTKVVMDSDTYAYNPASSGVPAWMVMVNANKIIDQILLKRAYMQASKPWQQGNFETQWIQFTTRSPNGSVENYDDYSASQVSDINVDFPKRDVVKLQTLVQAGDLEVATLSAAKIDALASKQYAAAQNIAVAQNKLFFLGNINNSGSFITQTFGLINDPSLNPATPATNGTGSSPLWSDKAQRAAPQDIVNDVVVTAYNKLQTQLGGNVNIDDKFLLIVSSYAAGDLNATNSFGLSALDKIREIMPNLEIIYAPEYQVAGIFQLIAVEAGGEDNIIKDLFTYKMRSHGMRRMDSSYREKQSFGSAGAGVLIPAAVATISGVY